MTLIINTLVFEKEIQTGNKQISLVDRIADLGADGIELRREYFKNPDQEINEIGSAIKEKGLLLNYSVPDTIFDEKGNFNSKLANYYQEAKKLGAQKIKFSTGNFYKYHGDLVSDLSTLPLAEIQTTVENDQTVISGNPDTVFDFLTAARKAGFNSIGATFDLGNLAFMGFDPNLAAKKLSPYVAYIHLKNPMLTSEGVMQNTESLDRGMYNWRSVMHYLPNDVQCAFEFAMSNDDIIKDEMKKFHEYFDNLR
ncbi:sugar phosphate isomerase/epimerase [Lactobacillus sp. ESL0785]|uniref:sugar phosphate isomerase/epimerase family protein n=1 Tax=Lactobacillus sp. ESL0785 TaxID=2983232 RepID=UPI0023F76ADB|nr:TIM barrel protein [Lactobacillus sp. ESL0785]WEV70903.1 sugar phosphate isomerase/epimerase [Lactobacillus sp. ESL0785]